MMNVDILFNQLKELQQHVRQAKQKTEEYDETNDSIVGGKLRLINGICNAIKCSSEEKERAEQILLPVIDKVINLDSDTLDKSKDMIVKMLSDKMSATKDTKAKDVITFGAGKGESEMSAAEQGKIEGQGEFQISPTVEQSEFQISPTVGQDKFQTQTDSLKDQANVEKVKDEKDESQQPNNSNAGGKIIIPMDLIVAPTMLVLCAMGPLGAAAALILFLKKAGKTKELDLTAFLDEFQKATNCDAEILDNIKNGIVDGANNEKLNVQIIDGPQQVTEAQEKNFVNSKDAKLFQTFIAGKLLKQVFLDRIVPDHVARQGEITTGKV